MRRNVLWLVLLLVGASCLVFRAPQMPVRIDSDPFQQLNILGIKPGVSRDVVHRIHPNLHRTSDQPSGSLYDMSEDDLSTFAQKPLLVVWYLKSKVVGVVGSELERGRNRISNSEEIMDCLGSPRTKPIYRESGAGKAEIYRRGSHAIIAFREHGLFCLATRAVEEDWERSEFR